MFRWIQFVPLIAVLAVVAGCGRETGVVETAPIPVEAPAPLETEPAVGLEVPPPPPEADTPEEAVDTTSKVSVLGYHKFSETPDISRKQLPTTIYVGKFREQMQTLVDNEIPVIGMKDFLAWRRGEKNIPPFAVIITIDDGYDSTYDLAFPIFKEFGFPFTIYPYTDFLGGGGKSLSRDEVEDMLANGGELGSHGITHGFLHRQGRRSDEIHASFLKNEATGSRRLLNDKLGVDPVTFSYPYGAYDDRVIAACVEAGYEAMVTVKGQKAGWETDLKELGRYIIHGSDDRAFEWALSSRVPVGLVGANNLLKETRKDETTGEERPLVALSPKNGSTVKERQPTIWADLSLLEGIDVSTLAMSVSGIGKVAAEFDEATKRFTYTPRQRLRLPEYGISVQFRREGEKNQDVIRWSFQLDALSNYLQYDPAAAKDDALAEDALPMIP